MKPAAGAAPEAVLAFHGWLTETRQEDAAARCGRAVAASLLNTRLELPGPVGERNLYGFRPRGTVLARVATRTGLLAAVGAALATGNRVILDAAAEVMNGLTGCPAPARSRIVPAAEARDAPADVALFEGDGDALCRFTAELAERPGPVVAVHAVSRSGLEQDREAFPVEWLVEEVSISTNTAAAGGNASLMSVG